MLGPSLPHRGRSRALAALALLVGVALAGCVQVPGGAVDPASAPVDATELLSDVIVQDHDHADPALHALHSANAKALGYSDLSIDVPLEKGNAEVVVQGDYAYVATLESAPGFVIVDVSDPASPTPVGRFDAPALYTPDVKVSDDGEWAFLGTQPTTSTDVGFWTGGLGKGVTNPGIYAVDVSDKENPELVSVLPVGARGCHNVFYYDLDGRDLVLCAAYNNIQTPSGLTQDPPSTKVVIAELIELGGSHALVPLSEVRVNFVEYLGENAKPHDVVVQQHPETGQHLMYLPYWNAGLRIVDISTPEAPREVGAWSDFEAGEGQMHYALPFDDAVHGRHITVTAPEYYAHDGVGRVRVFDTTDPTAPEYLGSWSLPGDLVIDGNYRFSPHNFDTVGTKVILSAYHAGVWVLDVADFVESRLNGSAEPAPVRVAGFYLPSAEPRSDRYGAMVPFVWSVVEQDGLLYASDVNTGLHVFSMEDAAGVPAPTNGTVME